MNLVFMRLTLLIMSSIADTTTAYVEPYLEFAKYLLDLDDDKLPRVVSISYGINEQVLPKAYAKQVCNIFGQLGTRGVSIIVASGDTGPGISCQSNDGKNTTKFLPSFPASCPYVTSVGGTEGNRPETATYFSSGGFSEYFNRPQWQDKAVEPYLAKLGKQWKGYFNREGRGYPDVAAQAMNYQIVNHDKVESADGTRYVTSVRCFEGIADGISSASAPLFAAMIALLNNCRFNKGKPALGFLNPLIYNVGQNAFTEYVSTHFACKLALTNCTLCSITKGKSTGCEGESWWGLPSPKIPNAGWSAVPGWDPVTGLGTPLFDRLKRLACP
jgi:tripeptidyl-peptidase-1